MPPRLNTRTNPRITMKKHLIPILSTLAALAWALGLPAQTAHQFTEGLYIQAPFSYGREAVYTDALLWHQYSGNLPRPATGQTLDGAAGQGQPVWMPIAVDTTGFFRPQPGAGGNLNSPNNPAGPGRIDRQTATSPNPAAQRRSWASSYLYLNYTASRAQAAVLHVRGNSAVVANGELHAGDPYRLGWMAVPVQLKKGLNEFFVRGLFVAAELRFPSQPVYLDTEDPTLPDIVLGQGNGTLLAGLVVVNASGKALENLRVRSVVQGQVAEAAVPSIPPYSTRKIAVPLDASQVNGAGEVQATVQLAQNNRVIDEKALALQGVEANSPYRVTFVSDIDGSVQYYAVNPAVGGEKPGDALFLSVHGAGVEAIGQARAYAPKDWGSLVAPTNRRPRGFNWEDWGRIDALEVLALAKERLKPDTQRIYLTGHSMGGHGTWFLGATYPDKWAAIAPAAGYPTLKGYGSADGLIPDKGRNPMEDKLLRSSNQSDVIAYATNYKPLGVYVLHGDADRTVSVEYARQMRRVLADFHPDFSYYEYPGGSHWYSNESVDWKPLFDYFQWHTRKTSDAVHNIDFTTANPGISASYYWAAVWQQEEPLHYSRIVLSRDVDARTLIGTTENTRLLQLDLDGFPAGGPVRIRLDSLNELSAAPGSSPVFLEKSGGQWQIVPAPSPEEKGPHRNGGFKEAFNHRMLYVYGTGGTREENRWAVEKARYDAESWYYRGNGAFDIIADHAFDPVAHAGRNIILVGNAQTNTAWDTLLAGCPIQVGAGFVQVGDTRYDGHDIGGYFTWKRPGSAIHTVGVITGTGLHGMQAATANSYFAGASGFPDYLFFKLGMLVNGPEDIVDAGFYTNEWEVLP